MYYYFLCLIDKKWSHKELKKPIQGLYNSYGAELTFKLRPLAPKSVLSIATLLRCAPGRNVLAELKAVG